LLLLSLPKSSAIRTKADSQTLPGRTSKRNPTIPPIVSSQFIAGQSTPCLFLVDIVATIPQYLVCEHAIAPFVAFHGEIGLQSDLNSSRRHFTHGDQEKSSQEKEEKVAE
jgi:hypothetical protein